MNTYACPNCGASNSWVADYYEAVNQTIALETGEDGEPVFVDYTGILDHYDDGSTEDECWRCQACDHVIQLGTFVMLGEETATIIAALLHYGLTCYDGRACITALRAMKQGKAADVLEEALSQRIYKAPGKRDWKAEEERDAQPR